MGVKININKEEAKVMERLGEKAAEGAERTCDANENAVVRGYQKMEDGVVGGYTFGTLAKAIVNVIKYRKYQSPLMSAGKAISLVSSVVSALTLGIAMLTAFGEQNDPLFRQIVTLATGAAVFLIVLAVAIYMIVHATKDINGMKGSSRP